ncbi:MAG: hypothetical protein EOP84_14130 [Verrucomicrobiaceae bacterium]|nr:MAG: hypothetical protein EOP84_14130 [Verrucomicrobiaceae bacterium]
MKFTLLLPLLAALFLSACVTPPTGREVVRRQPKPGKRVKVVERMTVRTTAYTHTEAGGRKNAIGGRLRFGGDTSSAASDWSWLPLGTRFRLAETGRIYVIEDYGSALVGKKTVDLYMPTRRSMNAWGVKNVEIEILEWGSRAMSLKLLEGRQRSRYVRAMVYSLRKGKT